MSFLSMYFCVTIVVQQCLCHLTVPCTLQFDPDLLPRQQLLEVCLTAVGTFPHDIQQLANDTLLQLAQAANGDEGATVATDGEVHVLLKALQSPSVAVRDVALQVRQLGYVGCCRLLMQ